MPITERVIPTLIFAADEVTRHKFLQKWCPKNNNNIELRELIDWDYYRERLVSVIHKIITIPASIQKVKNPVPGVSNPEWVQRTYEGIGNDKQSKISDMFQKKSSSQASDLMDLEDIENFQPPKNKISFPKITLHKRTRDEFEEESTSINQTTQAEESEISLRNNNKEEEEDTMEVEELESDHKTDKTSSAYKEWLKEQKGKWKKQRESRFKRKEIFGSNSRRSDSQMVRFIQHRKSLLVSNVWEIIQIAETRTPGEFIVWALVDNELQSIPIKVQRKFFLNSREQNSVTITSFDFFLN